MKVSYSSCRISDTGRLYDTVHAMPCRPYQPLVLA
uniref:Uncharacterized protein n=1 Tax=Anguilla anguilla TaxID=7936 RepID=A0A0E9TPS3_ANGAN